MAGVTAIDCNVAAVTVSTVEPVMLPSFALIVLVPVATPVARPPLVIVATEVVAEAQVTCDVRFCVLLSLKVPVAVNCTVLVAITDGFTGVTAIETRLIPVPLSGALCVDAATPDLSSHPSEGSHDMFCEVLAGVLDKAFAPIKTTRRGF